MSQNPFLKVPLFLLASYPFLLIRLLFNISSSSPLSALSIFYLLSSPYYFSWFPFVFVTLSFFFCLLLSCFIAFSPFQIPSSDHPFLISRFSCFLVFCLLFLSVLLGFAVLENPFLSKLGVATKRYLSTSPCFKNVKSLCFIGFAYFVLFQVCFSENNISSVVSNFKHQILIKGPFFDGNKIRPEPNHQIVNIVGCKKKPSAPCVWLKQI